MGERTRGVVERFLRPSRTRGEPPGHAPRPSGLGAPPTPLTDEADEAELDTLRGELVRELDRMAAGQDGGSASFRRI